MNSFHAAGVVDVDGRPAGNVVVTFDAVEPKRVVVGRRPPVPPAVRTDKLGRFAQDGFANGTAYTVTATAPGVSFDGPALRRRALGTAPARDDVDVLGERCRARRPADRRHGQAARRRRGDDHVRPHRRPSRPPGAGGGGHRSRRDVAPGRFPGRGVVRRRAGQARLRLRAGGGGGGRAGQLGAHRQLVGVHRVRTGDDARGRGRGGRDDHVRPHLRQRRGAGPGDDRRHGVVQPGWVRSRQPLPGDPDQARDHVRPGQPRRRLRGELPADPRCLVRPPHEPRRRWSGADHRRRRPARRDDHVHPHRRHRRRASAGGDRLER